MNNLEISKENFEFLRSTAGIRHQCGKIFALTCEGKTSFRYHPEKLESTVRYVVNEIKKNYPDLKVPFHSRWRHFHVGGKNREEILNQKISKLSLGDRCRARLDLAIISVLLDAGAGPNWKYTEDQQVYSKSEGLALASFHMFMNGILSGDGKSIEANANGLKKLSEKDIELAFQVSDKNPLVGVSGRALLMNRLAKALTNRLFFRHNRPGNLFDYLVEKYGTHIPATGILRSILESLAPIWPNRIMANGKNLGDVWSYSKLGAVGSFESLVPFHKLSQWMAYSLIEPLQEAGIHITGIQELTGLAEYRNGGLILDSGLVSLVNPQDQEKIWHPDSDLVIEWRGLTVRLLDEIAAGVQHVMGIDPNDFPLAKVLEGGTWWAGRRLAAEKRSDGSPPIKIQSDGTVF